LSADPGAFGDVRDEPLGTKRIAGVEATGHRITIVVPPGYRGNDQGIEMVDERWESAELQLLIQSRHSDAKHDRIPRDEHPAHRATCSPLRVADSLYGESHSVYGERAGDIVRISREPARGCVRSRQDALKLSDLIDITRRNRCATSTSFHAVTC
jgi:hypothetical protein